MNATFTLKRAGIAIVGILALASFAVTALNYSMIKSSVFHLFGYTSPEEKLATVSCALPTASSPDDEVYFVSCGGFF